MVVGNNDTTATGQQFYSPGHNIADLSITVTEQIKNKKNIYFTEK